MKKYLLLITVFVVAMIGLVSLGILSLKLKANVDSLNSRIDTFENRGKWIKICSQDVTKGNKIEVSSAIAFMQENNSCPSGYKTIQAWVKR